ncbi:hypothetical protein PENCOP_c002G03841 [Penicillium coprophilum]|uniref:Uncharacterized protein n=1 Tax=Penicillium coprophilum TaxID=36646 RepID=A0A1V6V3C4_9EURO|nr:hypothetical protein PENCOP_c002G03841 [Penicillium coprophilum]
MSTALSTTGGGGDNGHKGQGNHGKGASKKKRNRGRCGVCGVRGHRTHDHWRHAKAAPMPGKEPQSSTSLGRFSVGSREWAPRPPIWPGAGAVAEARTEEGGAVDHPGPLEQLEATLAQQQETIARLQQENAELSRLRLQEGGVEQVNEEPTAALSIADGLDAELDINMYLDSEGEEMTKSPSQ